MKPIFAVSILSLLVVASLSTALLPAIAASPSPRIVQFTSGYTAGGSDTSVSLTFQKPVVRGDTIILCAGIVSGNSIQISTGTLVNNLNIVFHNIVRARTMTDTLAQMWYGTVGPTGFEAIHLSYNSGPAALFGYELSGATAPHSFSKGIDNARASTSSRVASYNPGSGALVIACGGFFALEGVGTIGAGPEYTLDQSFSGNNAVEHRSGFSGTSTASPFHFSMTLYAWSEVSAGFV
ncbi:MAG: hypothetical protein OK457_00030 [Thaumarchaeota archaeon]|nr:hypothetical protein [Nitrososphaerota archaeon]